jgi:hypothetical protein
MAVDAAVGTMQPSFDGLQCTATLGSVKVKKLDALVSP